MVSKVSLVTGGFVFGFVVAYFILDQHFSTRVELVRAQGEMEVLNQTRLMTCRQGLDARTGEMVVQCQQVLYPIGGK